MNTSVTVKVSSTSSDLKFVERMKSEQQKVDGELVKKESWFVKGSELSKIFIDGNSEDIISYRENQEWFPAPRFDQGFLEAVHHAYNHHLPLVLSPDMIWLQVLFGLNQYMAHRAEDLRSAFVDFEGKKQLIIEIDGSFDEQDSTEIFEKFDKKLSPVIKQDWLVPSFSTTSFYTRMISQICLMGTVKSYFAYGVKTMCGIPHVTLEGTLEDWLKLKELIKKVGALNLDMNSWARILDPIMDQLINTYQGHVDRDWWNRVIHENGESGDDSITGWILAFFPFHDGTWQLAPVNQILSTSNYGYATVDRCGVYGNVNVPIKVKDENGSERDFMIAASCRSCGLNVKTLDVSPRYEVYLVQLPLGTITDQYDWDDCSIKHVEEFNLPKVHPHPLMKTLCWRHTCDKCRTGIPAIRIPGTYDYAPNTYRCALCDFDVCPECFEVCGKI